MRDEFTPMPTAIASSLVLATMGAIVVLPANPAEARGQGEQHHSEQSGTSEAAKAEGDKIIEEFIHSSDGLAAFNSLMDGEKDAKSKPLDTPRFLQLRNAAPNMAKHGVDGVELSMTKRGDDVARLCMTWMKGGKKFHAFWRDVKKKERPDKK